MSLTSRRTVMARKRYKPEEIVAKLRQVDGLDSQGQNMVDAIRQIGVGSVQNLSHFRLAERHPALAHAVMAPLICWSFSNSMFRYRLVDHAVPAMWRSLAAARLSG